MDLKNLTCLFENDIFEGLSAFRASIENVDDRILVDQVAIVPITKETSTTVKVRNFPKIVTRYVIHENNLNGLSINIFNKLSIKTKGKKTYDSYFEALFDLWQTNKEVNANAGLVCR